MVRVRSSMGLARKPFCGVKAAGVRLAAWQQMVLIMCRLAREHYQFAVLLSSPATGRDLHMQDPMLTESGEGVLMHEVHMPARRAC